MNTLAAICGDHAKDTLTRENATSDLATNIDLACLLHGSSLQAYEV
jgi:hypothetical protein